MEGDLTVFGKTLMYEKNVSMQKDSIYGKPSNVSKIVSMGGFRGGDGMAAPFFLFFLT